MDQQGGDDDDNSVELSIHALQNDVRFVRCPLCRRLSSSRQVVRKVHGDIRRDICCVCLTNQSEVCFRCGHLCMCSGCFDGLLMHWQEVVPDESALATILGLRSSDVEGERTEDLAP